MKAFDFVFKEITDIEGDSLFIFERIVKRELIFISEIYGFHRLFEDAKFFDGLINSNSEKSKKIREICENSNILEICDDLSKKITFFLFAGNIFEKKISFKSFFYEYFKEKSEISGINVEKFASEVISKIDSLSKKNLFYSFVVEEKKKEDFFSETKCNKYEKKIAFFPDDNFLSLKREAEFYLGEKCFVENWNLSENIGKIFKVINFEINPSLAEKLSYNWSRFVEKSRLWDILRYFNNCPSSVRHRFKCEMVQLFLYPNGYEISKNIHSKPDCLEKEMKRWHDTIDISKFLTINDYEYNILFAYDCPKRSNNPFINDVVSEVPHKSREERKKDKKSSFCSYWCSGDESFETSEFSSHWLEYLDEVSRIEPWLFVGRLIDFEIREENKKTKGKRDKKYENEINNFNPNFCIHRNQNHWSHSLIEYQMMLTKKEKINTGYYEGEWEISPYDRLVAVKEKEFFNDNPVLGKFFYDISKNQELLFNFYNSRKKPSLGDIFLFCAFNKTEEDKKEIIELERQEEIQKEEFAQLFAYEKFWRMQKEYIFWKRVGHTVWHFHDRENKWSTNKPLVNFVNFIGGGKNNYYNYRRNLTLKERLRERGEIGGEKDFFLFSYFFIFIFLASFFYFIISRKKKIIDWLNSPVLDIGVNNDDDKSLKKEEKNIDEL